MTRLIQSNAARLQALAQELLDASATPQEDVNHYQAEILDDLARETTRAPELAAPVRSLLAAGLATVGVPPNLEGLAEALAVLTDEVPLFLAEAPTADVQAVQSVFALARGALRAHPRAREFGRVPTRRNAPLFWFHRDAHRTVKSNPPVAAAWIPRIHRGLRSLETSPGTRATWTDYVESARFFVTHAAKATQPDWETVCRAFREGYRREPRATEQALRRHLRRLKAVVQHSRFEARPHAGGTRRHPSPEYPSLVRERVKRRAAAAENLTLVVATVAPGDEDPRLAAEDDEPYLDELIEHGAGPIVRRPPRLPGRFRHLYVRHNYEWWWDAEAGYPALWLMLQAAAIALWKRGKAGRALYLQLLPLLGRGWDELARARVANYNDRRRLDGGSIYVDPGRWWLFFRPAAAGAGASAPPWGWDDWIMLPLPPPLLPLARAHWNDLRQSSGPHPVWFFPEVLADPSVRAHLGALARALGLAPPDPCSLRGLADAFWPLLGHGQGLDRVAAYLIAGRGHFRARVQATYTSVAHRDLQVAWSRAVAAHQAAITAWLGQRPPGPPSVAPQRLPSRGQIGSRLGRSIGRLRETLVCLAACVDGALPLDAPETLARHHNAYTAYVTLVLLALGLRPRNDAWGYRVEHFTTPCPFLAVADKQSRRYREQRLLPLPDTAQVLLGQLARGRERLRRLVVHCWGSRALRTHPGALLFFLDPEDGTGRPYTLREFRAVLGDFGAHALDDVRLNVGRHVLRTALRDASLADDLIDLALGHQRAGREALALHAATAYGTALETLRGALSRHLLSLGVRPLAYLP